MEMHRKFKQKEHMWQDSTKQTFIAPANSALESQTSKKYRHIKWINLLVV